MDATEHTLECHSNLKCLHPKTIARKTIYRLGKIREAIEIKKTKSDDNMVLLSRYDGNCFSRYLSFYRDFLLM